MNFWVLFLVRFVKQIGVIALQEKTFVGLFDTEDSLIAALENLRQKGILPENMYIIAKREEDVEVFRQRTYDEIQSSPSNWLDRFIGFISGENLVRSMLVEVGFDEADLRKYETEIKHGKWLLYVEGEPEKTVYEIHAERYSNETKALDRSVEEAKNLNRIDNTSVGFGKDGLPNNEYRDRVISEVRENSRTGMTTNRKRVDKNPVNTKENGHLGKVGGESLDTPNSQPSHFQQQPQSIAQEKQHLHPLTHHDKGLQYTATSMLNESSDDVLSFQQSTSQEANEKSAPSTTQSTMQHLPNKPILIDLRGMNKDKNEIENWLIQDEDDLT